MMDSLERRNFLKNGFFSAGFLLLKPYLEFFKKIDEQSIPTWEQLVEVAKWCPTIHNLQPHRLKIINSEAAHLYYDPTRTLPHGDPEGIFVTIALGIFIEHLSIAAGPFGYKVLLSKFVNPVDTKAANNQLFAELQLVKIAEKEALDSQLIYKRRTSRLHYDGKPLKKEALDEIKSEAAKYDHTFFSNSSKQFIQPVIEANQKTLFDDLNNNENRAELYRLFRYTDADAEKYKDGLWYKAMCFPSKLMRSVFQNHEKWNHGLRSQVLGSYYQHSFAGTSTICWFSGKFDNPHDWINAGYMFARTWLILTKYDAYLHPFGTLITNQEAYAKMNQIMDSGPAEKKLWMIFRAGYSKVPVRSFRLATNEIILK